MHWLIVMLVAVVVVLVVVVVVVVVDVIVLPKMLVVAVPIRVVGICFARFHYSFARCPIKA